MRAALVAAALLAAASSSAEVLVLDGGGPFRDSRLTEVEATGVSRVVATYPYALGYQMQLGPDGRLYFGSYLGMSRSQRDLTGVEPFASVRDSFDIAVDAFGDFVVIDRWTGTHPPSAIHRVRLDGTSSVIDTIPGFNMMGLDVPHAGPYENGIILIGFQDAPPHDYYLYRYARRADGGFDREGPFGPLEATPFDACRTGGSGANVSARADGMSILHEERCSRRVLEHDLDGRFLGTFATVVDDPAIPDPFDPSLVFYDRLTSSHVSVGDDVWVGTLRHVYHYDPEGRLVATADLLFDFAGAICEAEPIPFASDGAGCKGAGLGYWKRQCLTAGVPGGVRGRGGPRGRAEGPGLHPSMRDGRLTDVLAHASRDLERWGVDACGALWPARPQDWRSKALMHLAALCLDVEDHRLGGACAREVDGSRVTVSDGIRQVEDLLAVGTQGACKDAARLAEALDRGGEP